MSLLNLVSTPAAEAGSDPLHAGARPTLGSGAVANHAQLVATRYPGLRETRVLLVEDNPFNRQLAIELLRDAGVEVTVAEDGQQAIDRLGQQPFDAVLMDCQLPVMNGYDAARAIRRNPRWSRLPILATTASALDEERAQALAAGMNAHLVKPIDVHRLYSTLWRWIDASRASRDVEVGSDPLPQADANAAVAPQLNADLPGIDVRLGMANVMNKAPLFERLLKLFLRSHRDFDADFRAAIAAGDRELAARQVHDLKSTAAALGAKGVARVAELFETACGSPASDDSLLSMLALVLIELDPVIAGIETRVLAAQRQANSGCSSSSTRVWRPASTSRN